MVKQLKGNAFEQERTRSCNSKCHLSKFERRDVLFMQSQIESYIDEHREEILDRWRELVNLEGKADELECMEKVASYLYDQFTQAGVECKLEKAHPDAPSVLTGVIGKDRPGQPVLLGGHYDTVFKKGAFGENPFHIDDEGKAHGPGCLDMKGGIIIALYVIKALESIGYKERPIRIVFCGDEEGGAHHFDAGSILRRSAEGCKCAFNMETGPINNSLCVGRKGAIIGSFVVKGVAAHSGNNFEAGRNAIVEAAHKMLAIDAMTDMEKGTNINVAVVNGGTMWNSIPDRCEVTYSGRFALVSEMERVKKEMAELMAKTFVQGTSTEYNSGAEGGVYEQTEGNMKLWEFCSGVSREHGYGDMGHVFLGGGSDAGTLASAGVPTLCSCGVVGEWNHTDREYAVADTMFTRTKLWCAVIQELDALK